MGPSPGSSSLILFLLLLYEFAVSQRRNKQHTATFQASFFHFSPNFVTEIVLFFQLNIKTRLNSCPYEHSDGIFSHLTLNSLPPCGHKAQEQEKCPAENSPVSRFNFLTSFVLRRREAAGGRGVVFKHYSLGGGSVAVDKYYRLGWAAA